MRGRRFLVTWCEGDTAEALKAAYQGERDLANTLIGAPENDDDNAAWNRTHRALEHGAARSKFRHTGHMEPFPE